MADEYIKREDAIGAVMEQFCASSDETEAALNGAIEDIRKIPTADVRPVVLCYDCIHYEKGVCLKIYDDGFAAKEAWHKRKPDDFCSYGEWWEVQDDD